MPHLADANPTLPSSPVIYPADDAIVPRDALLIHAPRKNWAIASIGGCSVSFSAKYAVNINPILRILKLFSAINAEFLEVGFV